MKKIRISPAWFAILTLVAIGVGTRSAHAVEVLINGGLEDSVGPEGWMLTQSVPASAPGDYNGNGVVDTADYVQWRHGGPLQNEVATPGTVTQDDYVEWRARFGSTASGGGAVAAVEHIDAANHPAGMEGQL